MHTRFVPVLLGALALFGLVPDGHADPCGMVPPIQITGGGPAQLERTGAQRTWVLFKDGVETIALRPGFTGNVEDFGMLIPFPTPPAIRKIEDSTFAHVEAAIDPPTLNVEIIKERWEYEMSADDGGVALPSAAVQEEGGLRIDEVRVLSQEAVGMYQVAVLEAGSPKALQVWMSDNGYQYPVGMDAVAQDYVNDRWCFVAVKARVGPESGIAPKPGMRGVDPSLPAGSAFDGHVQGMGFRFATKKAVVPMRLSVFNGADPRNVVYILTDQPVRIAGVPLSTVVRQVDGKALYSNLTDPIPLSINGGKLSDLQDHERQSVEARREPGQYNGVARDLIASDLMALREGTLSLAVEELDKELLNISEALLLRGPDIDKLHGEALAEVRAEATAVALQDVRGMHLTVVDGVFPGELLAAENLAFSPYTMAAAQNQPRQDPIRPPAHGMTFWR